MEDRIDERNRSVAMAIARELDGEIKRLKTQVLGVKLWSQPGLRDTALILQYLRSQNPDLKIIGGGGHADYFLGRVLKAIPALDALAIADGELALNGYIRWLNGEELLENVPNLLYRNDKGEVQANATARNDAFPTDRIYPCFEPDVYPAMSTLSQKMMTIPFEDSRGCQVGCGFCAHPIKSGHMRLRHVDGVVDEMEFLNKRYGFLHFTGSGSNTPFTHACRIYEEMKRRGLDLACNFFQSLRDFRVDKAQAMLDSHIPLLWIGIESASETLLNASGSFDKRRDMGRTRDICEFLNQAKIGYITSLIFPGLGETEETRRETVEFIRTIGLGHIVIYPPLLQPRTPWMQSPHIEWRDQELFLQVSQYGLEEVENRVLPPMAVSEEINESVLIDGKPYREIYYENVRFREDMDRVCAGERGYKREFRFTEGLQPFVEGINDAFWKVDQALVNGDFEQARAAMTRFNVLATAGSISATSHVARRFGRTDVLTERIENR